MTGLFGEYSSQAMKLVTQMHLVLRLRMSGAVLRLPVYALPYLAY